MLSDRRGSILLPGMAMGMILTMMGMHIMDTTKAILLRALGQNAVDAIALESAVWHAQGMNLIVLINVVMAAIMSILVAIRVAEILLIGAIAILTIAAAVASFFSFGTAGAAATNLIRVLTQALARVVQFENRVSRPIIDTLTKASDAERTIAAVMPYIALAHPVTLSNDVPGIPFSFSLVPAAFEKQFSEAGIKINGYKVETAWPARMGTIALPNSVNKLFDKAVAKLPAGGQTGVSAAMTVAKNAVGSLPVQEEDFYQLCGRAAELMVASMMHIFGLGGMDQGAIDKVSSFAAVIVGSLPSVMCTPISELKSTVESQVTEAVTAKCNGEKKKREDEGGEWSDTDQDDCKKKNEEAYTKQFKAPDAEQIKVARLWGIISAPKESPFLHTWGVTYLESKYGVDDANANGEFRHVCNGGGDAASRSCAENSMWSNGWYAKLVPVRNFIDEVEQKLGSIFSGWLGRFIGKNITGLMDELVKKLGGTNPLKGQSALTDALNRAIGTVAGSKFANGWWNRRLVAGLPFGWLSRVGVNKLEEYPLYLH
ncbi:MAG TPA: hypothetical protein VFX59_12725 [Polyangiales bacterium]|nr:hypothetical protein [Polyangiales bacterium]